MNQFRPLQRHQEIEFSTRISYLTVDTEFRNNSLVQGAGRHQAAFLTKQEYVICQSDECLQLETYQFPIFILHPLR